MILLIKGLDREIDQHNWTAPRPLKGHRKAFRRTTIARRISRGGYASNAFSIAEIN